MQYKVYEGNGYTIHTIKTDKFKNCSMEVMFSNKLNKDKITENNILVDILGSSSKKYPKRRDVSIELENLYASGFRGFVTRLGNSNIISFVMDFLNPRYCDKGFLDDVIKFSFDMIKEPNIIDGKFEESVFNVIKNRLKSDIESLKEHATRYAFYRSVYNMDSSSPSSYNMTGYLEQLEKVTTTSLVDTYNSLLNDYDCDIYVIGNMDMDEVVSLIKKNFKYSGKSLDKKELYVNNVVTDKIKDILETGKYEQDSFLMIYNLEDLTFDEKNFDIQLYNIIMGNGGLTSKLCKYLREENSLCYSVSSLYQKYDRLFVIYAGIDKKDKDKCISLVNKAMDEMRKGDFTDEELENAKKSAITSIRMSEDTQGGIINNYLFHEIDNFPLIEERIKKYNSVSREDIVKVANKIKLNTIYLLSGEDK